jgi:hypothetical protein
MQGNEWDFTPIGPWMLISKCLEGRSKEGDGYGINSSPDVVLLFASLALIQLSTRHG